MLDDENPDLINRDGEAGILTKPRPQALSLTAIVVAFLALSLAIFPGQVLEIEDDSARQSVLSEKDDSGVTLQIKNVSFSFGKKKDEDKEPISVAPAQADHSQLLKIFILSAAAVGVLGLLLSIFAHHKEGQTSLNASSAGICILAISWQYVLVGISIGVAAAILFLFLRHLG